MKVFPLHQVRGAIQQDAPTDFFDPRTEVDYIIGCVDTKGVCDEDLRKTVYEFFNVSTS
jgi:hypothetical protein